jgi:two-component system, chemotaxis family, sensor histidine kinase and response regulator PixL
MDMQSAISDPTYAYFLIEAPQLLQILEQELHHLRRDQSQRRIYDLMRITHTLKAMAASESLETLQTVAHSLEDVFATLCRSDVIVNLELEALLFQVYRYLQQLLTATLNHTHIDELTILHQATIVFTQLHQKLGAVPQHPPEIPTAAELGIDLTKSIFETDVSQRLEKLSSLIKTANVQQIGQELHHLVTVLIDLAAALNVPGLDEIAQTTIAALNRHPHHALRIARFALRDFWQVQSSIVQGQDPAIVPSAALRYLAGTLHPANGQATQLAQLHPLDRNSNPVAAIQTLNVDATIIESPPNELTSPPSLEQILGGTIIIPDAIPDSDAIATTIDRSPLLVHSAVPMMNVDPEPLEFLNHQVDTLLTHHAQQCSAYQQLQAVIERFQSLTQQHQHTLSQLQNRINARIEPPDTLFHPSGDSGPDYTSSSDPELAGLLGQALREVESLNESINQSTRLQQQQQHILTQQQQCVHQIQESWRSKRQVQLNELFQSLTHALQQLVSSYPKAVEMRTTGGELWVDTTIARKLYEPLLHLVRNAFDHGIESSEHRNQQGKPPTGLISLNAYQHSNAIVIELKDDGKGLDFEQIRQQAIAMGVLTPEQAEQWPIEQLTEVLFEPGFSTALRVSELSGRGFGLDIVKSQLQKLQGSVTVQSEHSQGTTFTLQIPYTSSSERDAITAEPLIVTTAALESPLAETTADIQATAANTYDREAEQHDPPMRMQQMLETKQLFVWRAGAIIFLLPYSSIEEYLVPRAEQIVPVQQQRFLHWQGQMLPIYQLSQLLQDDQLRSSVPKERESEAQLTLVLNQDQQLFALEAALDQLVAVSELVIQPTPELNVPSYLCGYATLTHEQVFVVDTIVLLSQALGFSAVPIIQTLWSNNQVVDSEFAETSGNFRQQDVLLRGPTILIVDDSRTVRQLLKLILQHAGYHVLQAEDGEAAIAQLQQHSDIQLVICDVEMPNMNGFEFLNHWCRDPEWANIPVVMLSSCNSDLHRQLAKCFGAKAYFNKPLVEDEFLASLAMLLARSGESERRSG